MEFVLALLAGLGIIHAANGVVHRFETEAAADLSARVEGPNKILSVRSELGPEAMLGVVERVTIHAENFQTDHLPFMVEPNRSQRGELNHLSFHLTNFDLTRLHVRRLDAEIPDCRFDFAAAVAHHVFRLTRSGIGELGVEVAQDDLSRFVQRKFPMLGNVRVTIDRDKVIFGGRAALFGASADIWIAGKLECPDGRRLRLVLARMLLNGVPVDPASVDRIVALFNPVVDLDRDLGLKGSVDVKELVLRDGVMRASGAVKVPDAERSGSH